MQRSKKVQRLSIISDLNMFQDNFLPLIILRVLRSNFELYCLTRFCVLYVTNSSSGSFLDFFYSYSSTQFYFRECQAFQMKLLIEFSYWWSLNLPVLVLVWWTTHQGHTSTWPTQKLVCSLIISFFWQLVN